MCSGAFGLEAWFSQGRVPAYCSIHPELEAGVQCDICAKLKHAIPVHKSYHCTTKCFVQHWRVHKEMHDKAASAGRNSATENSNGMFRGNTYSNGGETWLEVGRSRCYTPCADDVGLVLRYECSIVDTHTGRAETTSLGSITTSRVRPAPNPPTRRMIPISFPDMKLSHSGGRFTMLSYNLLADLYASAELFDHCPSWALAWSYRKQNLLRELLSYKADIMCLQEVQSDHYEHFLAPELQRAGYTPIFKKKTTEVFTNNSYAIDGCATFFRRDKFSLVKKYEVEFNKAALSLVETLQNPAQKKAALSRLLKDNVALIAVLEATEASRQLICVANTHIHSNPELNDVKLWQVHTLLKGLEKIAASADIPMLVAGDFNSTPGSAAHHLLVNHVVEKNHPDLMNDPFGINKPHEKLVHDLSLASAYSAFADAADTSDEVEKQRQQLDPNYFEPKFSNTTREENLTLDYILYTMNALVPVSLLELPSEAELEQHAPGCRLPCPDFSSDHIALMAEFQYRRHGA
uniref:CCR4-NOT transcription complex subunit 6 n=1 Tax=Tetraselmis sp. GSL018 TaxID=582737 RepID=A0A061SKX5_9CHLO